MVNKFASIKQTNDKENPEICKHTKKIFVNAALLLSMLIY
jgi:hypothetical protein